MGRCLRCPIPSLFSTLIAQQLTHLGGISRILMDTSVYFKTLCTPTPPVSWSGNMFRYQSFRHTPKIF